MQPMAKVEIFTGPNCVYCEQAKRLLARCEIPYLEFRIDDAANLREFARRLPRVRSIPQIFVDGEHIGSDQDLEEWVAHGRIKPG